MLTQEEEYTKGLKEELSQLTRNYEDQAARDQAKIQSVTKYVRQEDSTETCL